MHSAVVEAQSPVLNTFVNNTNFKEAGERHASLPDVDEDTFITFIQYAYTGAFEVAGTAHQRDRLADVVLKDCARDYDDDGGGSWSAGYDARPARFVAHGPGRRRKPDPWAAFKTAVAAARPKGYLPPFEEVLIEPGDDVADMLIRYTRLYLFADCYGIDRLMGLSLFSLGKTLIALDLKTYNGNRGVEERVQDVVALLQFCYNSSDPAPDQLTSLILRYVACNAERLWKNSDFQKLLATHAELGASLVGLLVERLD
ncbi:predicted protein [Chaetomium globosum CBS 148.51]|uniref:BTB domain-containing protein n=1 Tax=Chaetomium globosum (strain ATCC 6205 / CBS 148.51 / DSM 1962 / NBRC 6347 / NRRL 1970) TaxID=306901 RepID=Q2GU33_CHAGB|nr:uncharacterized protein CHGG_08521 [Chaetomium globosum CBS 148.51]EAQ84507.1 predicted protein [Chaetomium globosum CBS 148.51]